jgi:hypothetical protein
MKVWVLEVGQYEEKDVTGVYVSKELAIKQNPVTDEMRQRQPSYIDQNEIGWRETGDGYWDNSCEYDDCMRLIEMELIKE